MIDYINPPTVWLSPDAQLWIHVFDAYWGDSLMNDDSGGYWIKSPESDWECLGNL